MFNKEIKRYMKTNRNYNFKWWYCLIGYISFLAALMLNTLILSGTETLFQGVSFNVGTLFNATQFLLAALLCLLVLRLVSRNTLTQYDFGIHRKSIANVLGLATIIGLVFFGLSEFAETYIESLRKGSEEVARSLKLGENTVNDILILLNIGLLAPVAEEIVFRGVIFNALVQGLKKYSVIPHWVVLLIALSVTSYAFISSHGGGGQDAQIGFLAILSIFAALAFYYTKNLFAAIFVHAVNNNVVFMMIVYKSIGLNAYGITLICLSSVCLVLCLPVGLLFGRILPKKHI